MGCAPRNFYWPDQGCWSEKNDRAEGIDCTEDPCPIRRALYIDASNPKLEPRFVLRPADVRRIECASFDCTSLQVLPTTIWTRNGNDEFLQKGLKT